MREPPEIADRLAEIRESLGRSEEVEAALREAARRRTYSSVSDAPTRGEFEARLGQAKAEGETQFEKLRGDIRELGAKQVGKATFFTTILAAVAVIIAVLAYAGQWFGLGLQSHDVLVAAAKEGAAQALAAAHR